MQHSKLIDELSEKIAGILPGIQAAEGEAKQKLKELLQQRLSDLDLVSREEFAAQQQALQRAEQKISELEIALKELESHLSQ